MKRIALFAIFYLLETSFLVSCKDDGSLKTYTLQAGEESLELNKAYRRSPDPASNSEGEIYYRHQFILTGPGLSITQSNPGFAFKGKGDAVTFEIITTYELKNGVYSLDAELEDGNYLSDVRFSTESTLETNPVFSHFVFADTFEAMVRPIHGTAEVSISHGELSVRFALTDYQYYHDSDYDNPTEETGIITGNLKTFLVNQ